MRPLAALLVIPPLAACATAGPSGRPLPPTPAQASPDAQLVHRLPQIGERVRVVFADTSPRRRPVTAAFQSFRGDTLVLTREAALGLARWTQVDTVPLHRGDRLQVVVRSRSNAAGGLALGFAGGAMAGAVVGGATCRGFLCPGAGQVAGALLGGLLGGVIGASIGSNSPTEEWGTVTLVRQQVHLSPGGLGLRIWF